MRRLIVNADDFGRSHEINRAVALACSQGILTSASLMVNGEAAEEAIEISRRFPRLGVGLHLVLTNGHSTLEHRQIPRLVDCQEQFLSNPVAAGWRYFFNRSLRSDLAREIGAQFQKFHRAGLFLDHLDGHLNIHLHPTVMQVLLRHARQWGIAFLRLTRDPLWLNLRLASGSYTYRLSHAFIFAWLCAWARPRLAKSGIRHTQAVFGLLQTGRVSEKYLCRLLPQLTQGDFELYCHPSIQEPEPELNALTSSRVARLIQNLNIQRVRYQDLS